MLQYNTLIVVRGVTSPFYLGNAGLIGAAEATPTEALSADPRVATRLSLGIGMLRGAAFSRIQKIVFQALDEDPQAAYAYVAWGLMHARAGSVLEGLMAFDAALALNPSCLPALGGKLLLMAMQGDRAGASHEAVALLRALRSHGANVVDAFAPLLQRLESEAPPDIRYVNIGGGPNFNHIRWRNLEAVVSPHNPEPYHFSPYCVFPFADASLDLVYSSHCIEHLNDPTVDRVLAEAGRVVVRSGALILKIPDFDRTLADWRSGAPEMICAPIWGLETLQSLWQRRGVADTLANRAAMIFCGYWNDAYAGADGHFAGTVSGQGDAYHGPPPVDEAFHRELLDGTSPHDVAAMLRQWVVDHEPSHHFNHQNAWSRDELEDLLARHGFRVVSFDAETIKRRYHWVPDIADMDSMSTYCFAVPATDHEETAA